MTVLHRFAISLVALSAIAGCTATPNATTTPAPSSADSTATTPVEKPSLDAPSTAAGGSATPSAASQPASQPNTVANNPPGNAQEITPTAAGATLPFRHDCEPTESVFTVIETEDYLVSICGGDLPNTYVGVNKDNNDRIRLPLAQYEPDGSLFEAVNGDVSYLLVRNTPKGSFLTVTQGTRELLRQHALSWE